MKCKKCDTCALKIMGNKYKVNPITGELYSEKVYICNNEQCKNLYKEKRTINSRYF